LPNRGPIYSIDRFNLLLRMNLRELRELEESKHLQDYARSVKRQRVEIDSEARRRGYRSQLDVAKFDVEILRILSRSLRRIDYQLNYVEIACDVPASTESDAKKKSYSINKILRKLYSPEVRTYTESKEIENIITGRKKPKKETPYDHELLSLETAYTGGNNFEYKLYARKVPDTERPAIRGEWTFQRSYTLRTKIGVHTIEDLLRLNAKETFLRHYKRYIRYEEIDHIAHGRFILNMPANSPHVNNSLIHRGGVGIMGPERTSKIHMRYLDIKSFTQLRQHYAKEKERIKEKEARGKSLTDLESRIKKLSRTRLNSFFRAIPDPFLNEELQ
jgi:hypothetical protein